MQPAFPVCIFIKLQQSESCFQLAANLLFQRMRKLHAAVILLELFHLFRVLQRIKWQLVHDHFFFVVNQVIDIMIGP